MERFRSGIVSRVTTIFCAALGAVLTLAGVTQAAAESTNLAVTVRHAPVLNGNGVIEGSLQQLLGENATLNGGFTMTGDWLVPGTPTLRVNGNSTFAGTIVGPGNFSPSGYQITFNGTCSLRNLRTRTAPVSLPAVAAPLQPAGTRTVTINQAGQSIGNPATLRDLTLNGNVGQVTVPPGTYGSFTVNGGSGVVLGVAGGFQAVNYGLQNLNLNGSSTLKIVGPVVLTVANGFTANGTVGASNNPAWLQLQVAGGGFTLNGGCTVYGLVLAPKGTVIVNGNSTLVGTSASDQFILNGGGRVRWGGLSTSTNPPPVATPQSITLAENSSTNITLAGTEPQGRTLTFSLLTLPAHGTVSGTPPGVTYRPATNYIGSDAFTFTVNNGITDSLPATVALTVTQVCFPPTAIAQSLTNFEDTALPVTLAGDDPQGHALSFFVLTQPAHGTLSGTAPNLTYQPAPNYFGNDSFTFRVGNGVAYSLAATISITNQPVDDPPTVAAGPNQLIILPANTVNLAGSVTYDVFPGTVDTVLWSKVSGPGAVTFSNPSSTLTTATFSQSGIYRLRLFASDSFLSGSSDLIVTVDAPPVVNAGPAMTNSFPGTVTLRGSASDDGLPTNGTLTVAWGKVSGPGTVVFGDAAATNCAATFSTNGVYELRLTADDGIATNHSDVTVIENLPPVVNAGASILTNGLQAALDGSVTDDGLPGSFLSVQWAQSTGPGIITFNNASATNPIVNASQSGTYVLVLTACDGAATNSAEVVVTFNLPPVVNAGPAQTVNFGSTVRLAGVVTDDQLPYNILTSTWAEVSGPGNATFADASLTNTTVIFDQPGAYTLRLTASDTLATTHADMVIRVNDAPVVDAGTDQLVTLGTRVTLAGSYTDDGLSGLPVTTHWTQISGPAGAVFTDPAATSTTVNFNQSGVYVFQLMADDGLTNGMAQVTITVDQAPLNQTPVVTAVSPILINWPANQAVLSGTVSDDGLPNGGTLASGWSQISGPGPVTFSLPRLANALDGRAVITQPATTATFPAPGLYVLRLSADDGQGVNQAEVAVTVNQAPSVEAGTNQIITWPASQIALQGTATDDGLPAGSSLTTRWSKLSGPGEVAFDNPDVTNATATFSQPGVYVLRLTADDTLATNSDDVTLSIMEPESGDFQVEAGPDQLISLPNAAFLAGTVEIQTPVVDGQTNVIWLKLDGPGDVHFSDPNALSTAVQFSKPGSYTFKLQVGYAGGTRSDSLNVEVLPPPPDRITAARSNWGTDFWLTFLNNVPYYSEPQHQGMDLYISADVDTAGKVEFSNGRPEQRFLVRAGSTTIISTWEIYLDISDSVQTNAIHVISDHPVTVHALNYLNASTDGYLALPTAMLGTDYIVLAYRNSHAWYDTNEVAGGTEFAVAATEDDTHITITPSVTVDSRMAGVPYQIILQQGETYRLINYDDMDADLTGTTITADKLVAVLGGHMCAYVPADVGYADHLVEQLPPVDTWGRHFVTLPLAARLKGDTFRFLAATNGTRVAINGKIVATLDRGQFYEQIIEGSAEVLASQPILMAQYANGQEFDGGIGDPFMMLVPALEQFGGDCLLSTPSFWNWADATTEDIYTDYLNIIVRTNGMGLIQLDGGCIPAEQFQVISSSGYAGVQLPINPGTHHLSGPVPFGACIYGWAWCESYAFWSGVYSESVEPDTKLELTQTTSFAATGHEKTVFAQVTNGRGLPISDLQVSFSVSGANVAAGRVTTWRLGRAAFSYVGTNAGADLITASLADSGQTLTNTWIADADNAPPVVSVADTPPQQFSRTLELTGTATDDGRPVGGSLQVQWRLISGPAEVQFENATQCVTHAFCSQSGRYDFDFSADDSQFSSHAQVSVLVDDVPDMMGYEIPSLIPVGSPVGFQVDVSDDDGTVDRVEFYANDSLVGTALPPERGTSYAVNWSPCTNGWFQIRAVAFDDLGGSNSLDLGTMQVSYPPQVYFDNLSNGTVLTVPTNVLLHVTTSDPDGTVVAVSIYVNGYLQETSDGPDVAASWSPRQEGDYTLTAVATDDLGLTTSESVLVTVTGEFPHVTLFPNYTNQFGQPYIQLPIGVPFDLKVDAWIAGPYHITNVTVYGESMGAVEYPIVSFSDPPYQTSWTDQDQYCSIIKAVAEADSGAIGEAEARLRPYRVISIAFAKPDAHKPVAVGAPVALQLSVEDPGHLVETFDYFVNGQLLVEATNSDPVYWQPSAPGNYQLSAQANDRFNRYSPTYAEPISVTANFAFLIDGVSIVSPNDGDSLYVGTPAPVCLAFQDPTGDFDHAEIFTNGVSLGQTTNTCFEWVPEQTNDYSLTAVVYDHQGNASPPSELVLVHVEQAPIPLISLRTIPEGQTNGLVGFPLLVAANVSLTTNMHVAKVELFADGQFVEWLTNAPWLFSYVATNPGPHQVTARVTTELGTVAESLPINVDSTLQLEVMWEGVRSGEWVPVGTNKTLGIRLADPGSIFDHVQFLANDTVLTNTRFCFTDWTPPSGGDYTLRARAYDRFGNAYDTEDIILHSAALHPPQVSILSPVQSARFSAGQPVPFAIQASDTGSMVTNLSLYRYSQPEVAIDGDRLDYNWANIPAGEHEFTAVATDDKGLTGEAKVRIVIDPPVVAELLPPQNLDAQVLGCNAIQISWDTNVSAGTNIVVIERAEGTNAVWEIAQRVPLEEGTAADCFLRAATVYRYRAYVQNADGNRSVDSNVIATRTRAYIPGFAVLDLSENLEDGGAFDEKMAAFHDAKSRTAAALTSKADTGAATVDLSAFFALGLSDAGSVLLNDGSPTNYLWYSRYDVCQHLTDTNFCPFGLTRSGVPVGNYPTGIEISPQNILLQSHAGYWQDGFVDLTPDVEALRTPANYPPPVTPYPTLNCVADMNTNGVAVGVASWVWLICPDGQNSTIYFGPLRKATVWPGNNQPPINYDALQALNNESEFVAINDYGDIIGNSVLFDPGQPDVKIIHAMRSQLALLEATTSKLTDLGTLGGRYSAVSALNNSGVAVGCSTLSPEAAISDSRAVYWLPTETQPRQLPGYSPDRTTYAAGINDSCRIVGNAADTNGAQWAVLWEPNPAATDGLGYDLVNLNALANSSDWLLRSARTINQQGLIVGSGLHSTRYRADDGAWQTGFVTRPFLLIPNASLAVDYNRDGKIELNEKDDLHGEPYQFWINDDSDDGDASTDLTAMSNVPGAQTGWLEFDGRDPNYADHQVNGACDLPDWFPVYLNISNLLAVLPSSQYQYQYRLVQAEGALNFLYTNLRPEEAGRYLTNVLTSGFGPDFSQPAATATVQQVTPDGVVLSPEFLDLAATQGRGVLLFEARQPTTQPLRLEVWNDKRLVTALELPLRIGSVEDMYGWLNLRHVAGETRDRLSNIGPANWPAFLPSGKAFVFVHGYNVNEMQSRGWAAEMFKRLWWSGCNRRFYAVSWFGDDTQVGDIVTINFHTNVFHAFQTAPVLANFLNVALAGKDVTVMAHSLGNMVVCSAIQDYGARPARYFMVNGAVAMEAFDGGLDRQPFMTHPDWQNYPERLYASEWYNLFPDNDGRHGLTWRNRFQNVPQLTQLYNFYSSGEEVLANRVGDTEPGLFDLLSLQVELGSGNQDGKDGMLIGQNSWTLQEQLKGRVTARTFAPYYFVAGELDKKMDSPFLQLAMELTGLRAGNVAGSQYGGWGFNSHWDTGGYLTTVNLLFLAFPVYVPSGHLPPDQAMAISADDLQVNSFFLPFLDARLTTAAGSEVAANPAMRMQLLAEAIPSRTFATGANALIRKDLSLIPQANFNMNQDFKKRGWPTSRMNDLLEKDRWLHSDLRDVPYLYNGAVFAKFTELEGDQ